MNIILIGMRGSGKTTIAKLLAQKLDREHVEMDEMIVEKAGMSIPTIVKNHGWEYFRDRESEIAEAVSLLDSKVISTGGGAILRPSNVKALKKNGIFITLRASIHTLIERLKGESGRPQLTDRKELKEELEELLGEREKLYEALSDLTVDTDNHDREEVVAALLSKLKNQLIFFNT